MRIDLLTYRGRIACWAARIARLWSYEGVNAVKISQVSRAAAGVLFTVCAGCALGMPIAHSDIDVQSFLGQQAQVVDGNVVQGWTITALKPSSDAIPYTVRGTLWEATATDAAIQGTVIPLVSNLNARAQNGENYRVLFGVATPQGVNPSTLSEGQTTTGKIYFDVTGAEPTSVAYNDGNQDLATWLTPPPSPVSNGGSVPASAAGPASAATGSAATGSTASGAAATPPASLAPASQGTPLPAGSQGTPLPAGSQGTPLTSSGQSTASQGTPAPTVSAGTPVPPVSQGTPLPETANPAAASPAPAAPAVPTETAAPSSAAAAPSASGATSASPAATPTPAPMTTAVPQGSSGTPAS